MANPVTEFLGARESRKGAQRAADAQAQAAFAGIDEQRRQFDETRELLNPYIEQGLEASQALSGYGDYGRPAADLLQGYAEAGPQALQEQQALAGLLGAESQQAAIDRIGESPYAQQMMKQGEEAILSNASATGGLRGGNVQGALAQYRPRMMQSLIDQQYSRLGGISGQAGNIAQYLTQVGQGSTGDLARMGQASATGQASLGGNTAANISNLLGQSGAAQAGSHLAAADARARQYNTFGRMGDDAAKIFLGGGFGG